MIYQLVQVKDKFAIRRRYWFWFWEYQCLLAFKHHKYSCWNRDISTAVLYDSKNDAINKYQHYMYLLMPSDVPSKSPKPKFVCYLSQ